jgi:hypothetical protein
MPGVRVLLRVGVNDRESSCFYFLVCPQALLTKITLCLALNVVSVRVSSSANLINNIELRHFQTITPAMPSSSCSSVFLSPQTWEWDLAERSDRCGRVPKVAGSSPSGSLQSESTFRSDLLLTARGSSTWAPICCITRVTHSALSAYSRPEGLGWGAIQIPTFLLFLCSLVFRCGAIISRLLRYVQAIITVLSIDVSTFYVFFVTFKQSLQPCHETWSIMHYSKKSQAQFLSSKHRVVLPWCSQSLAFIELLLS